MKSPFAGHRFLKQAKTRGSDWCPRSNAIANLLTSVAFSKGLRSYSE